MHSRINQSWLHGLWEKTSKEWPQKQRQQWTQFAPGQYFKRAPAVWGGSVFLARPFLIQQLVTAQGWCPQLWSQSELLSFALFWGQGQLLCKCTPLIQKGTPPPTGTWAQRAHSLDSGCNSIQHKLFSTCHVWDIWLVKWHAKYMMPIFKCM